MNVPVVFIDDPAYPMEPYIYSGSLTSEQLSINACLSGVVEHTWAAKGKVVVLA